MSDFSSIRTFPSAFFDGHPFDATVLLDTDVDAGGDASAIIWNIEHGWCPRCEDPLPDLPEFPAGSRITACRSIPICRRCGQDEAFEGMDADEGTGDGISGASYWPIAVEEIEERAARWYRRGKLMTIALDELNVPPRPSLTGGAEPNLQDDGE